MVRRSQLRWLVVSSLCLLAAYVQAQESAPRVVSPQRNAGTATVTGTVLDAQSQHPVRLAQVSLVSTTKTDRASGSSFGMVFGGVEGNRSGIDGRFTLDHVGEGDYYVVATAEGYISAQAMVQAQVNAGVSQEDALRSIPTVHVAAGGSAEVSVSIERGAAVGGVVQWMDGLPATGALVSYEAATPQTGTSTRSPLSTPFGSRRTATVDDRGQFRLSGLAAGDYILSVSVAMFSSGSMPSQMRMYYPGVFRKSDAKPVSVRRGDERNDLQMVVDLSSLHTVSGTASAATGGTAVKSGTVSLRDSTDSSLNVYGAIQADGSFAVSYVPAGTYTMTVSGNSAERSTRGYHNDYQGGVSFAPFTQTLAVTSTDVTGLTVNLSPSK